jgi:hypothetical protein
MDSVVDSGDVSFWGVTRVVVGGDCGRTAVVVRARADSSGDVVVAVGLSCKFSTFPWEETMPVAMDRFRGEEGSVVAVDADTASDVGRGGVPRPSLLDVRVHPSVGVVVATNNRVRKRGAIGFVCAGRRKVRVYRSEG